MPLKTVSVPTDLEPLFGEAEAVVSRYFREQRSDPTQGTIEIFGERYILVRAASLSVEFFALARELYGPSREADAEAFARNLLFDLAHGIGKSDAANFHAKMELHDPIARLSAGPVHFSHTGWAFVDIAAESNPVPTDDCLIVYEHPRSFEADAWIAAKKPRSTPACIMNAGYSAGWCEESFGVRLVSSEILCRAKGDPCCRFIMAHPDKIEAHVERYLAERPQLLPRARGYEIPDLFARKRAEEALRQSRDELERRVEERTAELVRANEKLRLEIEERQKIEKELLQTHKLEAVGKLAGGIAHDFNNLMGVVIGHTSILQRRLDNDDPIRESLDAILTAGQRAARLTQQLLSFSRGNVIRREALDLNRVVSELGHLLRPLIGEDIELLVTPSTESIYVEADRGQLEQVVMNLAVNARDAMPRGGKLTIATALVDVGPEGPASDAPKSLARGRHVKLTVSDTGTGMNDAVLSQIYDPFFTTKGEGQGTGLGLSTVYSIVQQSRGKISVRTAPERGTLFSVFLPRLPAPTETADAPEPQRSSQRGTETVLLVEDQKNFRAMMQAVLTEAGYVVLDSESPHAAIAIAETHVGPIDLLLTDVVMPKMSGRELSERIALIRPETKVLFMSGYADDEAQRAGLIDKRATLVQKPFTVAALTQKMREVLTPGGASPAPAASGGPARPR